MSKRKITCFWCENEVKKEGDLCPSCSKRKIDSDNELEKIGKEYDELFHGMDCKDMIALFKQKDQRIEELEKENEEKEDKILDLKSYNSDLKETISKLSFSAVRCQAINDEVCQYILDNELLKKENAELKQKLENAIFPKYKIGKLVWVAGFIENEYGIFQVPLQKVVSGIMQRINDFIYEIEGEIYLERDIFATEQEARKRLEGKTW